MIDVDEQSYVSIDHNTSKSPTPFIPSSKLEPIQVGPNSSPTTKLFHDN